MDYKTIKIDKAMKLRTYFTILLTTLASVFCSYSQQKTITLQECQEKAATNYPAYARFGLIEKIKSYNLKNANMAYLPQISLVSQASWQSDVTKLDLSMPEGFPPMEIPTPDKDQYRVAAEVNQLIWDGGYTASQKKSAKSQAEVESKQLESEIYQVRERVNNLYFGILLLNEQLILQSSLEEELQRNHDKVNTYLTNGLANQSDLSAVKVEQLKAKQNRVQKEATRDAYIKMLSIIVGDTLNQETFFVKPELFFPEPVVTSINRPELSLFNAQQALYESQKSALNSRVMPTISLFAQGGYGKPALKMFENEFNPFFVGGIRLAWNIGNLYTLGNQKRIIDLQKSSIESQRETFLYNLNMQISQQQMEIEKYRKTMQDDEEIIRLQKLIRETAQAKVENGAMTVSDMLREITSEEMAKQAKVLHEIQFLMSIYNLKYLVNNESNR